MQSQRLLFRGIYRVNILLWRFTYFFYRTYGVVSRTFRLCLHDINIRAKHRTFIANVASIRLHQPLFFAGIFADVACTRFLRTPCINRRGVPRLQRTDFHQSGPKTRIQGGEWGGRTRGRLENRIRSRIPASDFFFVKHVNFGRFSSSPLRDIAPVDRHWT